MPKPILTATRRAVLQSLRHFGSFAIFEKPDAVFRSIPNERWGEPNEPRYLLDRQIEICTFCISSLTGDIMDGYNCGDQLKDLVALGWVGARQGYGYSRDPELGIGGMRPTFFITPLGKEMLDKRRKR